MVKAKVLEHSHGSGPELYRSLPPEEFSEVLPVASHNGLWRGYARTYLPWGRSDLKGAGCGPMRP